jgi:RNA polymerase sigma factor (sigma-70 family)
VARRPFKLLSDLELNRLSDEEVVAYVVAAREADDAAAIATAMRVLVYGRMAFVETMVARRVPEHAVDGVASEAMIQAMRAVFEGESVGEFVNLLKRVTKARIADYWRSRGRHGREEATLDSDREDRRRRELPDPAEEVEAVPLRTVIDQLMAELPEHHRAAIDVAIFDDQSSGDAARIVNERFPDRGEPMTAANVDQIKSRFRKALKVALEDGDTEPPAR